MQYEVEINGRLRQIVVTRAGEGFTVAVDGRPFQVNAARVDAQTLSLLVRGEVVKAYEVTVTPDPGSSQLAVRVGDRTLLVGVNASPERAFHRASRRAGPHDGGHVRTGPQRVVAPMPGKIVRVLVQVGEAVGPRQPLVVVEAMKMENELRALRDGTVAEIHVQEGQSVDAGAPLVVIA